MPATPRSPRAHPDSQSTDRLILIVDDDQGVCDLTGSMLELKGYAVLRASTGQEAVKLFQAFGDRIQLLVIDIVMPTMSGPIIAEQLRALRPDLPVLYVSGLLSPGHFQSAKDGWFLRKPYTQRLLVNKIRQLLSHTS